MRFALNVPNFGEYADPRTFMRVATEAEEAGWDALFVWDHILVEPDWNVPIADPWTLLAAAAAITQRIRLGPMVTPLPRRRPWVVARQAVTLDHLSAGRVTLGVGIGHPPEAEFEAFGEQGDARVRAEKLDEGLAILDGLWTGAPFEFVGERYRLSRMQFAPQPVQRPRIPVWVAGYWPHRGPFHRAARWDGAFPASLVTEETGGPMPIDELEEIVAFIRNERGSDGMAGFDVMVSGSTPAESETGHRIVEAYAVAGATWWSEGLSAWRGTLPEMEDRVRAGPPRMEMASARR